MSGVFISYRREDSSGYAGRLFDILSTHFGIENTYMDLDTIMVGDNFETEIEEKISQCDVLLAVIGERWLISTGVNACGTCILSVACGYRRLPGRPPSVPGNNHIHRPYCPEVAF